MCSFYDLINMLLVFGVVLSLPNSEKWHENCASLSVVLKLKWTMRFALVHFKLFCKSCFRSGSSFSLYFGPEDVPYNGEQNVQLGKFFNHVLVTSF